MIRRVDVSSRRLLPEHRVAFADPHVPERATVVMPGHGR
jgi:hypothetical protein